MTKRLWLVRHGETDWSAAGRLNGWRDVPLNERGRAQAKVRTRARGQRVALRRRSFSGLLGVP